MKTQTKIKNMKAILSISIFLLLINCSEKEHLKSTSIQSNIKVNKVMNSPEYLWLINGEILPIKSFTNESYQKEVIEGHFKKIDLPFVDNTNTVNHLLNNGRIVTRCKDYQPIQFNSISDFKKAREINTLSVFSYLDGLNSFGENFPQHTNKLGYELCEKLNINFELSTRTLKEIDEKMNHLDADSLYKFRHKHFMNIIAIVGDTFISESGKKNINSKWKMEKESLTFSPLLIVNNDRLDFWMYLYEDMFERFHEKPLEECYLTMVGIYETSIK